MGERARRLAWLGLVLAACQPSPATTVRNEGTRFGDVRPKLAAAVEREERTFELRRGSEGTTFGLVGSLNDGASSRVVVVRLRGTEEDEQSISDATAALTPDAIVVFVVSDSVSVARVIEAGRGLAAAGAKRVILSHDAAAVPAFTCPYPTDSVDPGTSPAVLVSVTDGKDGLPRVVDIIDAPNPAFRGTAARCAMQLPNAHKACLEREDAAAPCVRRIRLRFFAK